MSNSDFVFDVECCCSCSSHQNLSRHSESAYKDAYLLVKNLLKNQSVTVRKNRPLQHLVPADQMQSAKLFRNKYSSQVRMFPACGSFEIRFRNILLYSKFQLERFPKQTDLSTLMSIVRQQHQIDPQLKTLERYSARLLPQTNEFVEPQECLLAEFLKYQQRLVINLMKLQAPRAVAQTKQNRSNEISRLFVRRSRQSELKPPPKTVVVAKKKRQVRPEEITFNGSLVASKTYSEIDGTKIPPNRSNRKKPFVQPVGSHSNRTTKNTEYQVRVGKPRPSTIRKSENDENRVSTATQNNNATLCVDLKSVHHQMLKCKNVLVEHSSRRQSELEQQLEGATVVLRPSAIGFSRELYSQLREKTPDRNLKTTKRDASKSPRIHANQPTVTPTEVEHGYDQQQKTPFVYQIRICSSQLIELHESPRVSQGQCQRAQQSPQKEQMEECTKSTFATKEESGRTIRVREDRVTIDSDSLEMPELSEDDEILLSVKLFLAGLREFVASWINSDGIGQPDDMPNTDEDGELPDPAPFNAEAVLEQNSIQRVNNTAECIRYHTDYIRHIESIVEQFQQRYESRSQRPSPSRSYVTANRSEIELKLAADVLLNFSLQMNCSKNVVSKEQLDREDRLLFDPNSTTSLFVSAREFYKREMPLFPGVDTVQVLDQFETGFLGSIVKLLLKRDSQLIKRLFEPISEKGTYCIWLCDGSWKPVTVRDTFAFSNQDTETEKPAGLWPMLLQKAIAVKVGGYHNLPKMEFGRLFRMLTGAPTVTVKLSNLKGRTKLLRESVLSEEGAEVYLTDSEGTLARVMSNRQTEQGAELELQDNEGERLLLSQAEDRFNSVTLVQFRPEFIFNETTIPASERTQQRVQFDSSADGSCFILLAHRESKLRVSLSRKCNDTSAYSIIGEVTRTGSFFFGVPLKAGRYCLVVHSTVKQPIQLTFYSQKTVTVDTIGYNASCLFQTTRSGFAPNKSSSTRQQNKSSKSKSRRFRDERSDSQQL